MQQEQINKCTVYVKIELLESGAWISDEAAEIREVKIQGQTCDRRAIARDELRVQRAADSLGSMNFKYSN